MGRVVGHQTRSELNRLTAFLKSSNIPSFPSLSLAIPNRTLIAPLDLLLLNHLTTSSELSLSESPGTLSTHFTNQNKQIEMYPTTPRGGGGGGGGGMYTSATTPRSNRRSTLANLNSPFRVTNLAPPEFPALPPLNTKKYPSNPYAEDPEFSEMLQQDMDMVDSTVEVLSRSTEEIKRQLREHLTHLESERISYENRIRELGEVAKEMVKNQTKEREEMENAKENETNVNRQTEKLKVKLEGYQQEVREALTRLQSRRDRKSSNSSPFFSKCKS